MSRKFPLVKLTASNEPFGFLAHFFYLLITQYEQKEEGAGARSQERVLELKLLEAQLAKAKIEKAGE